MHPTPTQSALPAAARLQFITKAQALQVIFEDAYTSIPGVTDSAIGIVNDLNMALHVLVIHLDHKANIPDFQHAFGQLTMLRDLIFECIKLEAPLVQTDE